MIVYLFIAENEVPQEPVDFGYLTKMDTHKKEVAEESVVAVMKLNANPCVDLSEDKIYSENKNCCLRDWCDDNHKKQDAYSNFPPKVPTIVQLMDKEKSNNRSFKKECRHIDCTFGKQEEGLNVSGTLTVTKQNIETMWQRGDTVYHLPTTTVYCTCMIGTTMSSFDFILTWCRIFLRILGISM